MWFSISGINLFLLETASTGDYRQLIAKNLGELFRAFPNARHVVAEEGLGFWRAEVREDDLAHAVAGELVRLRSRAEALRHKPL